MNAIQVVLYRDGYRVVMASTGRARQAERTLKKLARRYGERGELLPTDFISDHSRAEHEAGV